MNNENCIRGMNNKSNSRGKHEYCHKRTHRKVKMKQLVIVVTAKAIIHLRNCNCNYNDTRNY